MPSVSVIIPARNEEATVGALLDDLISQDYPPDRLEIVVVDDRSDDGTPDIVRGRMETNNRIRLIDTRSSTSPFTHRQMVAAVSMVSKARPGTITFTPSLNRMHPSCQPD